MTVAGPGRDDAGRRPETADKRLRGMVDGRYVFDTTAPLLVWERPTYPTYHVPVSDVLATLDDNGDGTVDLVVAGRRIASAGHRRGDHVAFRWDALEHWFEEDEEVYVHPRDPYTRIDLLHSSRDVRVEVDGVVVAESSRPVLLLETGLPTRFYLPVPDVRTDLLVPSATVTHCPYKGRAEHWSVRTGRTVHEDAGWTYRTPVRESAPIAGLIAFYDERVDTWVDGRLRPRPVSPFA